MTPVRITTRPGNPFQTLYRSLSEDILCLRLRSHAAPRRHSSNPRVPPRDNNSYHPSADQKGPCKSRRRLSAVISLLVQDPVTILQLIQQLEITMDNLPAGQSQLPRFNLSSYEDQQIQIDQLRSASTPPPLSGVNTPLSPMRRRSLP